VIVYSAFRFVEAVGLYREAAWAEVVAAVSSAIYVPIEIIDLIRRVSLIGRVLTINLAVVAVVVVALIQRRG